MSYDVSVGDGWFNYTSNMRQFFVDYGVYLPELHGATGEYADDKISTALENIIATDISVLNEYNAPNGWGSWPTALDFLMRVRDACREWPEERVEVSA